MGHKELGYDVIEKFIDFVGRDICTVSKRASIEGRNMTAFIEPKRD
jgi:translation initiation factor IF-3